MKRSLRGKREKCWFDDKFISTNKKIENARYISLTLESQEKFPSLIDIAGFPGSRGGFETKILSSARNSSSRRCIDTFAVTTCGNPSNKKTLPVEQFLVCV